MMTRIGIVIVNYNSTDFLQNCLLSIQRESPDTLPDVVVVDNASQDFHPRQIEDAYPKSTILINDCNLGFSAACNQGLRLLTNDYLLLLNPDCEICDQAIERTAGFIDSNPEIGIAGCRVTNPDGTLQRACRRRIPSPFVAFLHFSGLNRLFPSGKRFDSYNMNDFPEDRSHAVEAVSGSFLMMRNDVFHQTGGLDERFFLYGEDLDLCLRTAQLGWKLYYFAGARVIHHKRRSSSTDARRATYHFYNAMELFYRKHFYPRAGFLERAAVVAGIRTLSFAKRSMQIFWRHNEVGSRG